MAVVLLVNDRGPAIYVTPRPVRWYDRVAARVRAFWLDEALARGAAPESSAALELRAATLIAATTRRRLARQIVQLLRRADPDYRRSIHIVAIRRRLVRDVEAEFVLLALRLLDERPVDVRGVARTRALLCHGRSPLYDAHHDDPSQLRDAINEAVAALELQP